MSPKSDYLNFLKVNEKLFKDNKKFVVVTFYKFFDLDNLIQFQTSLRTIFSKTNIKGTILLAEEGINGTILLQMIHYY